MLHGETENVPKGTSNCFQSSDSPSADDLGSETAERHNVGTDRTEKATDPHCAVEEISRNAAPSRSPDIVNGSVDSKATTTFVERGNLEAFMRQCQESRRLVHRLLQEYQEQLDALEETHGDTERNQLHNLIATYKSFAESFERIVHAYEISATAYVSLISIDTALGNLEIAAGEDERAVGRSGVSVEECSRLVEKCEGLVKQCMEFKRHVKKFETAGWYKNLCAEFPGLVANCEALRKTYQGLGKSTGSDPAVKSNVDP